MQQPKIASKPIVTLTLNTTIDLSFRSKEIRPIRKTRAIEEHTDPGGGGINVARVQKELGVEVYAIYVAGGGTALVLKELVAELELPGRCIDIAGSTRISFAVYEEISGLDVRERGRRSALSARADPGGSRRAFPAQPKSGARRQSRHRAPRAYRARSSAARH